MNRDPSASSTSTSGFSTPLASANVAIALCSRSTNSSCGSSATGVHRSGTPGRLAIASDPDEPLDDVGERLHRVDLVRARRAQQRFDLAEMREDQLTLPRATCPYVVGGAALAMRSKQHVRRRTEEHDGVEAVVEARLVRDGS